MHVCEYLFESGLSRGFVIQLLNFDQKSVKQHRRALQRRGVKMCIRKLLFTWKSIRFSHGIRGSVRGGGKRVRTSEKLRWWGGYPLNTNQFRPICKLHWGHFGYFFLFCYFFSFFPSSSLFVVFLNDKGRPPPLLATPWRRPCMGLIRFYNRPNMILYRHSFVRLSMYDTLYGNLSSPLYA